MQINMEPSINEQAVQIFINKKISLEKNNKRTKKDKSMKSMKEMSIMELSFKGVSIEEAPKTVKRKNTNKKTQKSKKIKNKEEPEVLQQLPELSLDEIEKSVDLTCKELFSEMQIEDMTDSDVEEYMDKVSGDQFNQEQLPIMEEDGSWEPYYLDTKSQLDILTDLEIEYFIDNNSGDQFKEDQIDLFEDFHPCNDEIDIIFWDSDSE